MPGSDCSSGSRHQRVPTSPTRRGQSSSPGNRFHPRWSRPAAGPTAVKLTHGSAGTGASATVRPGRLARFAPPRGPPRPAPRGARGSLCASGRGRLPERSFWPGRLPADAARRPAVGKRRPSTPTAATSTSAGRRPRQAGGQALEGRVRVARPATPTPGEATAKLASVALARGVCRRLTSAPRARTARVRARGAGRHAAGAPPSVAQQPGVDHAGRAVIGQQVVARPPVAARRRHRQRCMLPRGERPSVAPQDGQVNRTSGRTAPDVSRPRRSAAAARQRRAGHRHRHQTVAPAAHDELNA